jgi:hypothetical protein
VNRGACVGRGVQGSAPPFLAAIWQQAPATRRKTATTRRTRKKRSRPVKWCTTLSASSSPDVHAAAGIAITSSPGALAPLAAALTACGVGRASNEEQISKTATTYLRALADGDSAKACAQLTRRARGGRCQQVLKERLSRLDPEALTRAADGSLDIDVQDDRATAGLSEPQVDRFMLTRVRADRRIDAGYNMGSASDATAASVAVTKVQ